MKDGFELRGLCQNSAGETLKSCYELAEGVTTATNEDDYVWSEERYDAGECHLDECNGYEDEAGNFFYATSEDYPYVPICRWGRPNDPCGLY